MAPTRSDAEVPVRVALISPNRVRGLWSLEAALRLADQPRTLGRAISDEVRAGQRPSQLSGYVDRFLHRDSGHSCDPDSPMVASRLLGGFPLGYHGKSAEQIAGSRREADPEIFRDDPLLVAVHTGDALDKAEIRRVGN